MLMVECSRLVLYQVSIHVVMSRSGLVSGVVPAAGDEFVLKGGEERFGCGVVESAADASHQVG